MNPTDSFLKLNDIFFYLSENYPFVWPELLTVNRLTRDIALRCFAQAGLKVIRSFPSLMPELDKANRTDGSADKAFMRIIHRLHEEAKHFNCDQPYPVQTALSPLAQANHRLEWESVYYLDLIKKIQDNTKIYKEEAFNSFVKAVAVQIGLVIPQEMRSRKFWDEQLKDNEQLKQMTELDLMNRHLKFLPPEIGFLSNLKELNLGGNQLKELPIELCSLPKLQQLHLNNNQIQELPAQFVSLSNLILLNLSYNGLSKIFEEIGSLSNLRHLRLMNNNLTELSPAVKSLLNLEYLNLSDNPLGKWPEEVNSLKTLMNLHLNNTGLKEIPSQLAELHNLKVVSLGTNQLTEIDPQLITSLSKLETLFLRCNPLNNQTMSKLKEMNRPYKREIEFDG
jgi:Leucine rich repeat